MHVRTRYWTFDLYAPWTPLVRRREPEPEPQQETAAPKSTKAARPNRPYDMNRDDPPAPVLELWKKRWKTLLIALHRFPDAFHHCVDELNKFDRTWMPENFPEPQPVMNG